MSGIMTVLFVVVNVMLGDTHTHTCMNPSQPTFLNYCLSLTWLNNMNTDKYVYICTVVHENLTIDRILLWIIEAHFHTDAFQIIQNVTGHLVMLW